MEKEPVEFKRKLCRHLTAVLEKRALEAEEAMQALKESLESETKSSAGDKYETAREMIRIELDKYEVQLSNTRHLLHELSQIDLEKNYNVVETGSLVVTDSGKYFMAIGVGKVEMAGETIFVISLASPLGQALAGKKAGETGSFQGRNWKIDRMY